MFAGPDEDDDGFGWFLILAVVLTAVLIASVVGVTTALTSDPSAGEASAQPIDDASSEEADAAGEPPDSAADDSSAADSSADDTESEDATADDTTPSPFTVGIDIGDVVTLTGTVPDEATAELVRAPALERYGPDRLRDELVVDGSLVAGGEMTIELTGTIAAHARSMAVGWVDQLAARSGADLDDQMVVVPDEEPIEATATFADGIVTLSGIAPDQSSADRLVDAAVAAMGADRVVNELALFDGDAATAWTVVGAGALDSTEVDAAAAWLIEGAPDAEIDLRVDVREVSELEQSLNALSELEPINFGSGSAVIEPASTATLDQVATILLEHPGTPVTIEGHTDSDGAAESNRALSQARADAVRTYLEAAGVDPATLTSIGRGEEVPIDTNATPEGKRNNRRITFVL